MASDPKASGEIGRAEGDEIPSWRANAEATFERIVESGDDYGDVANSTGDDLRNALVVACEEVRLLRQAIVFADGAVRLCGLQHGEYEFVLADLYNTTTPIQGALTRAGCHPRGAFHNGGSAEGGGA